VPLLPYVFLTYSPYVPSRQMYMASMVLVSVMSYLILGLKQVRVRQALVGLFIAFNIGYMWVRNDPEFENRAAPTTELLMLLRSHQPTPVAVEEFPYPAVDIAKDVSRFAPEWNRDWIHVNEPRGSCRDCIVLRWDAGDGRYSGEW
jgi:hypothetical protein